MNGSHLDPNVSPDPLGSHVREAAPILQRILASLRSLVEPPDADYSGRRSTMVGPLGGCFVVIVPETHDVSPDDD